jgi:hypothetical protein
VVASSPYFTPYMVADDNSSEGNYIVLGHMVNWSIVFKTTFVFLMLSSKERLLIMHFS